MGDGLPWQKTYRFLLGALLSALMAVFFWVKDRSSRQRKRGTLDAPTSNVSGDQTPEH
jgi:hypothetical protein